MRRYHRLTTNIARPQPCPAGPQTRALSNSRSELARSNRLLGNQRTLGLLKAPGKLCDPGAVPQQTSSFLSRNAGFHPASPFFRLNELHPAPTDALEQEADRMADGVTDTTCPQPPEDPAAHADRLESGTRTYMESRFGHNFAGVRVHTGPQAEQSAHAAQGAYTVGRDSVFAAGEYQPNGFGGRRLLAHELTHVLQQGAPPPIIGLTWRF